MDAFVTRDSRTREREPSASSVNHPTSSRARGNSSRLPPSDHIPSFYASSKGARKEDKTSNRDSHGGTSTSTDTLDKGKKRAVEVDRVEANAVEGDDDPLSSGVVEKDGDASSTRTTKRKKLPPAHSGKLKQSVIEIQKSLKSSDNPITHSSAYSSAFHYVSCSTGHQRSNGRSRAADNEYMTSRNAKLKTQAAEASSSILSGVRAYINGVTTPLICNLELIRLIQENGGEVKYNFSKKGCTHIICSTGLSASKTHKEMTMRSTTKVVTPQWVIDCIEHGKKLAEAKYTTLRSETQASIKASLGPLDANCSNDPPPPSPFSSYPSPSILAQDDCRNIRARTSPDLPHGNKSVDRTTSTLRAKSKPLLLPSSSAPSLSLTTAEMEKLAGRDASGLGKNASAISIPTDGSDVVIISSSQ